MMFYGMLSSVLKMDYSDKSLLLVCVSLTQPLNNLASLANSSISLGYENANLGSSTCNSVGFFIFEEYSAL